MHYPLPEYIVGRDVIKVIFRLPVKKREDATLKAPMNTSKLTDAEPEVYDIACEGNFTTAEIYRSISISERTVRRALTGLIEPGYVERIEGNKQGKWIPVSRPE